MIARLLCRWFGHRPVWHYDGSGFCRRCRTSGSRPCVGDPTDGFDGPHS